MMHLVFALPAVFVAARTIWPLAWSIEIRTILVVAALAASQFHLWSRISSGSVFAPEFPRSIVVLSNWAFGTLLLLAVLQLAIDAVALVARLGGAGGAIADAWRIGAGALAMTLAAVAVQQAVRIPPLADVEVAISDLPPRFDGYRILQLTDLHLSRLFPERWARELVVRANALDTDLVVVTGDLIDGTIAARRADVEPLRALQAPDGVWMVPGNHEHFFEYADWMRHYAGLGLRILANRHVVLERGADRLVLAGVNDLSAPATGLPGPDLAAALAGAPEGVPVVLLDHQPMHAREAAARGVSLQLSGHTHGGMIRGFDRLVALGNAGFVSGRYRVGAMTLYVSNGTALWPGFALRLGRPSELTRITLRRTSK